MTNKSTSQRSKISQKEKFMQGAHLLFFIAQSSKMQYQYLQTAKSSIGFFFNFQNDNNKVGLLAN